MSDISLSNTCVKAALPSGNHAVYEVQPQHLNLQHFDAKAAPEAKCPPLTLNQVAISYGRLIAVKNGQEWYDKRGAHPAWSCRITDLATVAALEACPSA